MNMNNEDLQAGTWSSRGPFFDIIFDQIDSWIGILWCFEILEECSLPP